MKCTKQRLFILLRASSLIKLTWLDNCMVTVRLQKVLWPATLTFCGHQEELFRDPAV